MNIVYSFTSKLVNHICEPLSAAKEFAQGALTCAYMKCGGTKTIKLKAEAAEEFLPTDQKVSAVAQKIVKEYLKEKGIDTTKVVLAKNINAINQYDFFCRSSIFNDFTIINIPQQVIERIEKENKLAQEDKGALLHEYGHWALNHHVSSFGSSRMETGALRVCTYAASAIALAYFGGFTIPVHIISCGVAKTAGFIYSNLLQHKQEYEADQFAASYGKEERSSLISFGLNARKARREGFESDKSIDPRLNAVISQNLFTPDGDFRYPLMCDHPSWEDRIRAIS